MDELTAAEKADIELVDGHSDDLADSVENIRMALSGS